MGKECGAWVSRRLWGGGNTSPLKTTAWEATVPLDTLLERCTMTIHHEISARSSLMPAGDGSALLSDTLSPTRQ